jgi:hypothetical protein
MGVSRQARARFASSSDFFSSATMSTTSPPLEGAFATGAPGAAPAAFFSMSARTSSLYVSRYSGAAGPGDRGDQLLGQVELRLRRARCLDRLLSASRQFELADVAQLVRVSQHGEKEQVAIGHQGSQVLPRANDDLGQRDPLRRPQGLAKEEVRLAAGLLRLQVVGGVEELGVDLVCADGREHVDRLCRLDVGRAQVVVGHHDETVLVHLEPFDHVLPGDFLARLLVDALVVDRREVALVHQVECQPARLHCGKQGHRDRDETERDGASPDGV